MKKQISALNALRTSVKNVSVKAGSLNQSWKSLNGAVTPAEQEALGLASMAFKSLTEAWAEELKVAEDGKTKMCLYLPQNVTVKVDDGKGGTKDVNVYERIEGKKGVTFKAVKRLELGQPKSWTPALIVEALCQSRFVSLAKQESVESFEHAAALATACDMYMKRTVKAADGSTSTSFVKLEKAES